MTVSIRACVTAGVAVVAASAIVAATSVEPHKTQRSASEAIALASAVTPVWPAFTPASTPDDIPTLADEIQRGIIPSLGAPLPTPPTPGPIPTASNINQAVKNIYNAAEPWVRYGFELATYAVGWVPWVGWLSPQIMIFYNFGERIVRSITFNVDDWLFGPLPFLEGLRNVARDSWNALVQLGIDEWNFWLPPLPPLPPTAQQAMTPTKPTRMGLQPDATPDVTTQPSVRTTGQTRRSTAGGTSAARVRRASSDPAAAIASPLDSATISTERAVSTFDVADVVTRAPKSSRAIADALPHAASARALRATDKVGNTSEHSPHHQQSTVSSP